jgi:drug/metabolite transporter (DMT)-like permease
VRGYVTLLLILSAIWGASYLFIKVALRDLEPAALVELRLLFAAPVLVAFLVWREGMRGAARDVWAVGWAGPLLGALGLALPFFLISWGEQHIDSGVAAIANATVPLFNFLLVLHFAPAERFGGGRLVGLLVGILGVAVLTGVHPRGGAWAVAGTLAVVVASLAYAGSGVFGQKQTERFAGPPLAAASILWGLVLMLPVGVVEAPSHVPGWKAFGSAAALGIAATGIAQLLVFRMLRRYGSARTSLITYLLPPIAVVYGIVFLSEPLTVEELGGMALILLGVALGSGVFRLPRRAPLTEVP